jgi:copper resistance protein B
MKRVLLANLSLAISSLMAFNAAAQDHSQHVPPPSVTQKPQPAVAEPARRPHVEAPVADEPVIDHAAMGHEPPPSSHDPHSQHDTTALGGHAGMDHGPQPATEPRTPIPPVTDADRAAAVKPPGNHAVHDNTVQSFVLFNRLEAVDTDDGTGLQWEGQGWVGTDLNKLWLRSEGERDGDGRTEAADLEVLYGRAIAPWWDVVAGLRHDFQPGGSQDFAAIGIVGLAPYKFEVEATAYIGESGQTAARVEAEYETLLTNRLILQPLVELNFYGKNDAERAIGSGLSTAEVGLRLRYEITRRFAPYVGVEAERAFGRTADFRREHGEGVDDARLVAGIRIWF